MSRSLAVDSETLARAQVREQRPGVEKKTFPLP